MSMASSIQLRPYVQDISYGIAQIPALVGSGVGYLGDRVVVLLHDASMILKSPDSIKYTVRGIVELFNAIKIFIDVEISDRIILAATTFQTAVSGWKVVKAIQYF